MIICKFGGTSVGTARRIKDVAGLVPDGQRKVVVLSANGDATDHLVELCLHLGRRHFDKAFAARNALYGYYFQLIDDLFDARPIHARAKEYVVEVFRDIQEFFHRDLDRQTRDWIITRGEMISTVLFSLYLESAGIAHRFFLSGNMIHKQASGLVDTARLKTELNLFLDSNLDCSLFITQGYMCTDHEGHPSTLGRGGSDYTASLLGQAAGASEIRIWSDVDGFLNNDPGLVRGALPLSGLSYGEAEELAYFGARILHPQTISPAKAEGIPVVLKNTLNPQAPGTLISRRSQQAGIKAAASKDGICLITVHSARMLMATGFLRGVFEIFERYHTSVDMVTTSEVSISLTIDDTGRLEEILAGLEAFGNVTWQEGLSIVCIVGDLLAEHRGKVDLVFQTLKDVPVRMISYGAARNSISLLVETKDRIRALEALNPVILENIKTAAAHV